MRRLQSESPEALLQATADGLAALLDGAVVAAAPTGAAGDAQAQLAKARDALLSMTQE